MKKLSLFAGALLVATTLSGSAFAATDLSMWYHGAGNEVEGKVIHQIVDDFNASQSDWKVTIESFPQTSYNDSVTAAALAGNLPDILDMDGPNMPNWAWSGYMQPLPIDESVVRRLPARHEGHVERQALFDRPVGRRGRALCPQVDPGRTRTPRPDARQALDGRRIHGRARQGQGVRQVQISARSRHERPGRMVSLRLLALPAVASAATSSTARPTRPPMERSTATPPSSSASGGRSCSRDGYAPGTSRRARPTSRTASSTATSPSSGTATGARWRPWPTVDDVLFLPAPDFGHGGKIGAGSWQFGVSAKSAASRRRRGLHQVRAPGQVPGRLLRCASD